MFEVFVLMVALGIICGLLSGGLLIAGLLLYPLYKKQGGKKNFINYLKEL